MAAFQLFGITYLTGRIKLTLLFHGALAEITYKISSPTATLCRADCKKCYGPGTCAVLQCAANWADSDLDLFGQFLFGLYHPWRKKLWKFKKSRFNAIYLDLFFGVFWVICFLRIGSHGILDHHFAPPFGRIFGHEFFHSHLFPAVANLRGDGDVMTGCEMQCGEVGRGSKISMGRAVLKDGRSQWYDK